MVKGPVQRFDIWLVHLDPTRGSEIKKTRPCIVLSPDEMSALKTVIIAPMTSQGFLYPTRIPCQFQGKKGLILLDQMRAVDNSRLIKKIGTVTQATQHKIVACLQELFAL